MSVTPMAAPPPGDGGTDPMYKWYEDVDGDTFGNAAFSRLSATKPSGFVSNKTDLDDNNPYITNIAPTQYFYQDIDGDTFGDPNSRVFYSIKPPGYVTNNLDCNDNNGALTPNTVWYRDGDHDGFGNRSITIISCMQPTDYVLNQWDYDDGNGAITNIAPQTFYRDFDQDTFGSPTVTVYCSVKPGGYVTNNTDCNDADKLINPNKVWYRDVDGDNFGILGITVLSCTRPSGYTDNGDDCNDAVVSLHPNTVWYFDSDGDGSGIDSEKVYGCYAPAKYVRRGGDCDDNNVNINPDTTWYRDGDGDGFGVTTNFIKSCTKPGGYVLLSGDCDDGNKLIKPNTIWYYDNDGDGHGGSQTIQSCTKPEKYVDKADDCDDYDVTVYVVRLWYRDEDGDSFGDGANSFSSCDEPYKYVLNKTDLDDGNPYITNIAPTQYFYQDIDGDTFGDPNSRVFYSIKPPGYVTNNLDCNDNNGALTPNTVWYRDGDHDGFGNRSITIISCMQPTDYVLNQWDYDDGNGAITNIAPQTFYRDFDQDTFGSPTVTVYCSVKPGGYVTNNTDCNDADKLINPNKVWYRDVDGDNFGIRGITVLSCSKPTGYADNGDDCNDSVTALHPNTVWYFDSDGDGSGTNDDIVYGCYAPAKSKYVRRGGDCDDNNVNINPDTMWYRDGDGDGFGVSTNFIQSCTQPVGYILEPGDCDDGNKLIKDSNVWYFDGDGDDYGDSTISIKSCTQPYKYVEKSGDCDDSNPTLKLLRIWYFDSDGDGFGQSTIKTVTVTCEPPTDYVDNAKDYDDNSGCITNIAPRTFYEDYDKDTFGNLNVSVYCSNQPAGYVTNNSDYDDRTGNIINIAPRVFYEDYDKDTFGNPNVSVYYSLQPTGYVVNNTDCDDTMGGLNPNTKWYADNERDGLGDPSSFVQQCTKPAGNYVANYSDNCPLVAGTSPDCNSLASPSSEHNYIITTTYKAPTTTILENPSPDKAQVNITYFDGLGRPIQQIANKQSNSGKDIITHIGYDDFGRQTQEYLPYVAASSNMAYDVNAGTNTVNFYSTEKYENTANPFSEKKLESSPLSRVLKQAAPGTDWAMDSGHEIKLDYQTNTDTEVKLYKTAATWNAGSGLYDIAFSDNGTYFANELMKTVTYDENTSANRTEAGGSTVEFKDKEGKVVLKRNYESGTKHDTYYVYDIYGNLTYVIPPKADGTINQEVLDGLCYQYKYDYRNRLAEKKLPGKQWEFIVYDKLDRPVATGPANSPFKDDTAVGWLITKYDAFNRPVYTGWLNLTSNASSRISMQNAQNTAMVLFETKQTSGAIDGIPAFYTNTVAPTSIKLLTVNYYDNYVFPNVPVIPTTVEGQSVLANIKTLTTGSWTRAVTTASANLGETAAVFYDAKARPIRSAVTNYLGGYTNTDSKLDSFSGQLQYMVSKHKRTAGDVELVVKEAFTYSPQDLLLTHTHQINGGANELLAANTYDELGQLSSKNVGNSGSFPLQKVDYTYNIRGWMTGINNDPTNKLVLNTTEKDLFGFKINYNTVEQSTVAAKALYNGNIAETAWTTGSDGSGIVRWYGYKYDQLNRLKDATYQTPNLTNNKNYFGENMDYDSNGNIIRLQRKFMAGVLNDPYDGDMDNLNYFFATNSNQLMKVTDISNEVQGFKDDKSEANDTTDDYAYDVNGNMTKDDNKGITLMTYNHLNLPTKITFGTTGTIDYIYNAAGVKLEKKVTDNGIITLTNYLGGYQYKNSVLQFFPTAEGYVEPNGSSFKYVFQYKDHLGNVRLSYSDADKNGTIATTEIVEESNYYPFGLKHKGYNDRPATDYKYKYNGKELQDELGLNLYDYGARNYDPALGRWMNIDPLAEKYFGDTPYNYVVNNPVNAIDPDGMDRYIINDDGKTTLALKENKSDVIFAIDKNGNLKDTNKDGEQNDKDGLTIKSVGLIGQLVNHRYKDNNGTAYTSVGEQSKEHEEDYFKLFKYASDNAKNSEFSLSFFNNNGKDYIELGTYNDRQVAPTANVDKSKIYKTYHSHSDTKNDVRIERYSIGDRGDGWMYGFPDNDFYRTYRAKITHPKYVYFPNSSRLYNVTQQSIDYVKKISKPSDFKVKR